MQVPTLTVTQEVAQSATQTVAQTLAADTLPGLKRLDAQLLLLHVLGKQLTDRAWLLAHGDAPVAPDDAASFTTFARRHLAGEPLAYITGHQAFYGLNLAVDARVLVPRPDTETLVDWALEVGASGEVGGDTLDLGSGDVGGEVLDLGTGSGAVALALKHARPGWRVWATDASAEALEVAKGNAQRLCLEVHFLQGNWFDALQHGDARRSAATFALIVSNPPYIADGDPHLAALATEPLQALASGPDGLNAIREIIASAAAHLAPGGWLLLEHGYDQAVRVRDLLKWAGFGSVQSRRDLAGIERCTGGQLAPQIST